ncbi:MULTISPECIES: hypothetical protein [unclassified Tolypothrix]|uniref:Uncharacterized protein n=1 Tax=Microchaete diplosiphon TaxID=1197 RepID=Q6GZZ4_MICDP|nr:MULTISPECIES: hypothetical protein [unclassified Tolypothrix]AAT41975.1 hypothetical protein [Fremyella diplosiphon Fd33]BAY89646.1 hypothetical protein NIES3275_16490 [Microchaete diplosiphon NIES-3275]EKE97658.1 hypothetical protein FDUTEX481_05036 [Tolypothrix sp. PCC 7601]MBE9083234.1 hypothetical protein [Tolypothrix sp. LEGE 11397]UYD23916.1 hypothetical protein HGR01_20665 [Tolypothrix sp. PCC 7712]
MEIKTISYQRVLNLGNYESKRLEMFAELHPDDDIDSETSALMETVERKIRENAAKQYEAEISSLKQQLHELKQEIKQQIDQGITKTTSPNPETSAGSEDAW